MHTDERKLGCLEETDVVVVGGTFAGIAAAVMLREAGKGVCVIESRTYLGTPHMATLRPWFSPHELTAIQGLLAKVPSGLTNEAVEAGTSDIAVVPDVLKTELEDALLQRDISLFYQLQPLDVRHTGDVWQLEVHGKAGRFVLKARALIDATTEGVLGRRVAQSVSRSTCSDALLSTLEFTGVNMRELESTGIELPKVIAPSFTLHRGHQTDGHLYIEYVLSELHSNGVADTHVKARFAAMSVAKWLMEHHSAFAKAKLATTSYELTTSPAIRICTPKSETGGCITIAGKPYAIDSFQPAVSLYVLGSAADLDDEAARQLHTDVSTMVQVGTDVARHCAKTLDKPLRNEAPDIQPLGARPLTVDVLVIGGGTSGASAAIAAGEHGARTLLVEQNAGLGGTGTIGGVNSYWYGRRSGFSARVQTWVQNEHAWMGIQHGAGRWNIEAKMFALLKAAIAVGVQVCFHSTLVDVHTNNQGKVTGARVMTPDGLFDVRCQVLIDATGDGDAAVRAGAESVYGSDREHVTMWYSLAPLKRPGLPRNNWTSTVDIEDPSDITRAMIAARRRYPGHDHSPYLAPRETRHILGDVRLTLTDQLRMRKWPDVVNIAFSNHDIKGQSTSDWIRMGLIPPNLEIEIPLRALLPKYIDGLLVTGKAISATHDGLPAIRMQADLENLGSVCGMIAAMAVKQRLPIRQLPIEKVQEMLVEQQILPGSVLNRTISEEAMGESEMQFWIEQLDDSTQLYNYSDMEFHEVQVDPIPIVMVCTAGKQIVPLLRQELSRADSPRRLMVARALAWYGDESASPVLLQAIETYLQEDGLPYRDAQIRHTQASPDQGAMPDLVYLLHTYAMLRDERILPVMACIADKLKPTFEEFQDNRSGIFHYVDALCELAEGICTPECIDILEQVHDMPLFRNRVTRDRIEVDFFEERLAYLEVTIGRALARCGSKTGLQILVNYLQDNRRLLARYAKEELLAVTKEEDRAPDAWQAWVNAVTELPTRPWDSPRGLT